MKSALTRLPLGLLALLPSCGQPPQHGGVAPVMDVSASASALALAPAASMAKEADAGSRAATSGEPPNEASADPKPAVGLDERLEKRCSQEPSGGAWSDRKWIDECTQYSWSLLTKGDDLGNKDLAEAAKLWRRAAEVTLPYGEPARRARLRLGDLSAQRPDQTLTAICHFTAALAPRISCHAKLKDRLGELTRKTEKFPGCKGAFPCGEETVGGPLNADVLDKVALEHLTNLACHQGLSGAKELWMSVPAHARPTRCEPDAAAH